MPGLSILIPLGKTLRKFDSSVGALLTFLALIGEAVRPRKRGRFCGDNFEIFEEKEYSTFIHVFVLYWIRGVKDL